MADRRDLIPPDDPRFQGAQFISDEARVSHTLGHSSYLQGATWRWTAWKERPAIAHNPKTGEQWTEVWDHDHCHFCYDTAFSERYDDDLREGWTTSGPRGKPSEEWKPNYHWVCPECFDEFRDQFDWSTEP